MCRIVPQQHAPVARPPDSHYSALTFGGPLLICTQKHPSTSKWRIRRWSNHQHVRLLKSTEHSAYHRVRCAHDSCQTAPVQSHHCYYSAVAVSSAFDRTLNTQYRTVSYVSYGMRWCKLEMCMGMEITGIPWVPWDSQRKCWWELEWERSHGSGREWESKYCSRTRLVQAIQDQDWNSRTILPIVISLVKLHHRPTATCHMSESHSLAD